MVESTSPIRYRYASSLGEWVDILALMHADRRARIFECISCGEVLLAVMGEQRAWHFRHKSQSVSCSKETYLHRMGKRLFRETYEEQLRCSQPYWLNLPRKIYCRSCERAQCERGTEAVPHDLTLYFDTVLEEMRDGEYVPDLLLTNARGEKIYVEIAVTHRVSEDKAGSGTRIIEFDINAEEDFFLVRQPKIDVYEPKVRLLNFKLPAPVIQDESKVSCDERQLCFSVTTEGRAEISTLNMFQISRMSRAHDQYASEIDAPLSAETFVEGIEGALEAACTVRDCSLCDHRFKSPVRYTQRGGVNVECLRKGWVNSTRAVHCSAYSPDLRNLHVKPSPPLLLPDDGKAMGQKEPLRLGEVPKKIYETFKRYARGEKIRSCFLCRQRDISGYIEKPQLLVSCRVSDSMVSPMKAADCGWFAPHSREEIRRRVSPGG